MLWLLVACTAAESAGVAWLWFDRDRRHQNCRWWSRWKKKVCEACVLRLERECGLDRSC